jgi:uncharacterized protein YraI
MVPIQKKLINYNFNRGTNNPKYIVIHDTGNNSKGANALAHYNYFNGGNRNASAHLFVDDSNIIQTVEFNDSSWHCGDGYGRNGITNQNSIGVEICVNSDGNYEKAIENTLDLVRYLMKEFNISLDKVVRHYDASGKNCPASMSGNGWEGWNNFMTKLTNSSNTIVSSSNTAEGVVYCTADTLNVRDGAGTDYPKQGVLNMDERVALLDKSNGWYKVRYYNAPLGKTMIGWASSVYLRIEKDVQTTIIQDNKPKKHWVISNYIPTGEYGFEVKAFLDKYFKDITGVYIRSNSTGMWAETCYLPIEKCQELKTRLGNLFWEIKSH